MKKMLKIIAMLLVIATVVFAAGCSSKSTDTNKSVANGSEENTVSANITAENVSENTSENVSENITLVPVDNNLTANNTSAENVSANNTTEE